MQHDKVAFNLTDPQRELAQYLGKLMVGTAAVGGGIRGLTGMRELWNTSKDRPIESPQPMIIKIPYQQQKEEEEKRRLGMSKFGDHGVMDYLTKGPVGAKSMWEIPAAWPLAAFGSMGSGLLGHQLVGKLIQKRKEQMRTDKTEAAKQDYEKALTEQFQPLPSSRIVSANNKTADFKTKAGLTALAGLLAAGGGYGLHKLLHVPELANAFNDHSVTPKLSAGIWPYGTAANSLEHDDRLTEEHRKEYENPKPEEFDPSDFPQEGEDPDRIANAKPSLTDDRKFADVITEATVKALLTKTADDRLNKLSSKLDELADAVCISGYTKSADDSFWNNLNPWSWTAGSRSGRGVAKATGMYGVLAPLLAGASGLAVYNRMKEGDPNEALVAAIKKHQKERQALHPPEVYAQLTPMAENNKLSKTASDEIGQKAEAFVKELLGD